MSDLSLNSQALTGFAGTLRKLLGDFQQPLHFSGVSGDAIDDDLSSLSQTDQACGNGLHAYLTALASMTEQAAAAAQRLEQDLLPPPIGARPGTYVG
ncbi:MAG: hypothetical protein HOW97_17980 [Catenulispora sp.]|nr:hypothetical protein [Catenulispora sp.]